MGDHRNSLDIVVHNQDEHSSSFDTLQSQLDAFMEQEKATLTASGDDRGSDELQERLDGFISNLQSQMDSFTAAHPASSTPEKATVQISEVPFEAPEKLIPAPAKVEKPVSIPKHKPLNHSPSYASLIFRVFMGAALLTAIVVWFTWPTDLTTPPQELSAQNNITNQLAPAIEQAKSVAPASDTAMPKASPQVVEGVTTPQLKADAAIPEDTSASHQPITDGNIGAIVADKATEAPDLAKLSVNANIGNIRQAPETTARVLFRLKKGATVTKLSVQGEWYQVRLNNGTTAWAHKSIF